MCSISWSNAKHLFSDALLPISKLEFNIYFFYNKCSFFKESSFFFIVPNSCPSPVCRRAHLGILHFCHSVFDVWHFFSILSCIFISLLTLFICSCTLSTFYIRISQLFQIPGLIVATSLPCLSSVLILSLSSHCVFSFSTLCSFVVVVVDSWIFCAGQKELRSIGL